MNTSNAERWRVVLGGIICQYCAGMLYSWSIYVNPLVTLHSWTKSSVTLTMSITTFLIPCFMILAGKLLPRHGPTRVALAGAAFLTAGLVISSFASSLTMLYLGFGVLGGMGVGFMYGVPIATCVKWFPDRKGMISGLVVAGFGLGSIIFAPIATKLIVSVGPHRTFLIQGVITAAGALIGAPMMKTAPDGYRPAGWTPPAAAGGSAEYSYSSGEMLRTRQYWFLLVMYLFVNMSGLMVIGHAAPIAQAVAGLTPLDAGAIVSVLAIANTLGRFAGGSLTDQLGPQRVVTLVYIVDALLLIGLRFMTSFGLIALGIGGLAVCFGAMMGAYPTLVLYYFGPKYLSTNYALVFLAYGIGGILGPQIASASLGTTGSYNLSFLIIAVSCAAGAIMSVAARPPVRKPAREALS